MSLTSSVSSSSSALPSSRIPLLTIPLSQAVPLDPSSSLPSSHPSSVTSSSSIPSSRPRYVPIIDLREEEAVQKRHIRGSVHIPASTYADRSLEFPPRNNPLILLVDTTPLCQQTLHHIQTKFLPDDIVHVLVDTPDDDKIWTSTDSLIPSHAIVQNTPYPLSIQPQLWRASPLIEHLCNLPNYHRWIVVPWLQNAKVSSLPSCVRIMDAGCGTGRNAIYTIQQLAIPDTKDNNNHAVVPPSSSSSSSSSLPPTSFFIVGIDNRRAMIEKAVKFVQRMNMEKSVQCIQYDIDKYYRQYRRRNGAPSSSASLLSSTDNDSLNASGFLHLPLSAREPYSMFFFIRFTHKSAIAQSIYLMDPSYGGFIVIDGFHTTTPHPSDRESQLDEGETVTLLEQEIQIYNRASIETKEKKTGWSVQLIHEQRSLSEDNRPMLHVIVQIIPSVVNEE